MIGSGPTLAAQAALRHARATGQEPDGPQWGALSEADQRRWSNEAAPVIQAVLHSLRCNNNGWEDVIDDLAERADLEWICRHRPNHDGQDEDEDDYLSECGWRNSFTETECGQCRHPRER